MLYTQQVILINNNNMEHIQNRSTNIHFYKKKKPTILLKSHIS